MHQTGPSSFCDQPAHWRHEFARNVERHLTGELFYCDEHVAAHVPADVVVDEPLGDVIARRARDDRARHGTTAPAGA